MTSLMRSGIGGLSVNVNESAIDSLNLHLPHNVETSLEKGRCVTYYTSSPVEGTDTIEFHVPSDPECFFDLSQTRIDGHFIVHDAAKANVKKEDNLTLSNHYAACLFSQIEVYLNGTQVCDLSAHLSYPFKQYIDSIMSYHYNTLNHVKKSEGYYNDMREYCYFNNTLNAAGIDESCDDLEANSKRILDGKKVYFCSTLPVDLFQTDKFLPSDISLEIRLKRFSQKFGLYSPKNDNKDFFITLKDVKLTMRKILPKQHIRNRLKTNLLQKPYFLPYKDSQMKFFHIPMGSSCFSVNNINTEVLPNQIIFFLVRSDNLTKDPDFHNYHLRFQTANVHTIMLKNNGRPVTPKALEFNNTLRDYVELYDFCQSNIGTKNRITLKNFAHGFFFIAYDLTPDKCNSFHNHPSSYGNLELDLTFSVPTEGNFTLVSYAFYNSGITIDKNLQVTKIKY